MKTITIRELHEKTGRWVRGVWRHGEIRVTDNGQTVAKLVPDTDPAPVPYFARRKVSAAFRRLERSGKTGTGTDSTIAISEDREDRAIL
jgi:antitoxin (DNA-binding transcriptional repressor) of toxin-antitoxin stability system